MDHQQPAASEETPSSTSNPSGRVEYLMLGFASSRSESHLIQIRIPNLPANDADFFRFLATQHKTHRRNWHGIPRFWKFVSGIYFVKFRTRAPSASCDVIRVVGVDNLPNADERGWTRKINRVPPPGPQTMLNYVEYPRRHERSRRIFLQVPRKLDSAIPSRAGEVGWGLYYFERTRWSLFYVPIAFVWFAWTMVLLRALLDSRRDMAITPTSVPDEMHTQETTSAANVSWALPLVFAFFVCGNVFHVFWIVDMVVGDEAKELVLPKFTYSSSDD